MFVNVFMSDVEFLEDIPLSRGTLLWPKLKSAIILGIFTIVIVMIFIHIYTGYKVEKKAKDRVEKDCSKILDETIKTSIIPKEFHGNADYDIFFNSLKVFFSKYNLKEEEKDNERIKDELIANFTHDIKTPLTSVIGYLNLLETDSYMSEKSRIKYTEIALSKSLYLEKLLDELFYLTKYDFDHKNKSVEQVNLTLLLNQLKDEFYPQLLDKKMKFELKVEKEVYITTYVEELAKALGNLIKNAISYGYEESNIILEALIIESKLILKIINKADTLSEDELSLIFSRFYRSDTSRNSSKGGSGLGLAIAKTIIEDLGGSITAYSNNNCFTMSVQMPNVVDEKPIIQT